MDHGHQFDPGLLSFSNKNTRRIDAAARFGEAYLIDHSQQAKSTPRKAKATTKTDAEWSVHQECIQKLYIVYDLKLEAVMNVMEVEEGFQAS